MKTLTTIAAATLLVVGCQKESTQDADVVTEAIPVAFNSEGAPTAELHVPDMYCRHGCVAKVKEVLTAQQGVKDVKIDFETKTATVAVNTNAFNAEAALAALVDHQFNGTKLISRDHK